MGTSKYGPIVGLCVWSVLLLGIYHHSLTLSHTLCFPFSFFCMGFTFCNSSGFWDVRKGSKRRVIAIFFLFFMFPTVYYCFWGSAGEGEGY
jgi:hypothetical membrane protein